MSDAPADKRLPLLVFDGDCGFCKRSIVRWRQLTEDRVAYAPYQQVADDFPDIPRETFHRSVVLIEPDGSHQEAAAAVFRSLAYAPRRGTGWWAYRHVPGFKPVCEFAYRFVANHRPYFSWITQTLWGEQIGPASHLLTRWLFLRLLGIVYLIAFVSLGVQVVGLIGENGITPAADFLERAGQALGDSTWQRVPTIFWWGCSDAELRGVCIAGAVCSLLLIFRVAPALMLAVNWVLYLSLVCVGGPFMNFQWDVLLLEAGLIAIVFAPWRWFPRLRSEPAPSWVALWLQRWLLFRLMLLSGIVKFTSGDVTWRNLTALDFHYETQPLPAWTSWYAYQLPEWFQQTSLVVTFIIELVLPFLIFAPRRLRFVAAGGIVFLMAMIGLTGNYNFFNLLTIALCVLLLDDRFLRRYLPQWLTRRTDEPRKANRWAWARRAVLVPIAFFVLVVTTARGIAGTWRDVEIPPWSQTLLDTLSPWRSFNAYGLFRVITTDRPEIIVEGSNDRRAWKAYEFRWKPGDLSRAPAFVQPHQPRLDWQMWFAALGDYRSPRNGWFLQFMSRLAEGQPEVLALLAKNPFPDAPPRYLRARIYTYHFTDAATRKQTGDWWTRTDERAYTPIFSRRN